MKKIILILIFFYSNVFAQNLKWEALNLDLGKNISTILQDSSGKIITFSEKGVYILNNLSSIERIDDLFPDSIKISCIALDTNNFLIVGTFKHGLYKYNVLNKTFSQLGTNLHNPNVRKLVISKNNQIVISTIDFSIYGLNLKNIWDSLNVPYKSPDYFDLIAFDKNENIYVGKTPELKWIKYKDEKDWNKTNFNNNTNLIKINKNDVYLSYFNSGIFYHPQGKNIFQRYNAGIDQNQTIQDILFSKQNEIIVLTDSSGVYYSNNDGVKFEKNNEGLTKLNTITGLVLKDNKILISVIDNGLFISEKPKNMNMDLGGKWIKKNGFFENDYQTRSILRLKLSSNNSYLFSSDADGIVRKWKFENGKFEKKFYGI